MFSSNITRLMKEKRKTFRALEGCGVSRQTIHKARQDAGISECRLSTLGRIANALEVPVKELFDGEYGPDGVSAGIEMRQAIEMESHCRQKTAPA